MQASLNCYALIKESEGLHTVMADGRIKAYADPIGIWTIGYGAITHRDEKRPIRDGDIISRDVAERWLKEEIDEVGENVKKVVLVPITQSMLDALISFAFNLGMGNLKKSTLLRELNAAHYEAAAQQFRVWIKADGKVLPGLVTRRQKEETLFRKDGFPQNVTPTQPATPTTPTQPVTPPAKPTLEEKVKDLKDVRYLLLTKTTKPAYGGLNWCRLDFVLNKQVFATLPVVTGMPQKQQFKTMAQRVDGSGEPLGQGRYQVLDMKWGERNNYQKLANPNRAELGPMYVPLIPQGGTDKAFSVHADWSWVQSGINAGRDGGICLPSVQHLQQFVALLRQYDPKLLVVEWGV